MDCVGKNLISPGCDPGMSEERKKVGAGFWIVIAAIVALAYPVSIGPACWISSRAGRGSEFVSWVYSPVIRICDKGPDFVRRIVRSYSEFGAPGNWVWIHYDDNGLEYISWEQIIAFM